LEPPLLVLFHTLCNRDARLANFRFAPAKGKTSQISLGGPGGRPLFSGWILRIYPCSSGDLGRLNEVEIPRISSWVGSVWWVRSSPVFFGFLLLQHPYQIPGRTWSGMKKAGEARKRRKGSNPPAFAGGATGGVPWLVGLESLPLKRGAGSKKKVG
jgi:hypothetical protein